MCLPHLFSFYLSLILIKKKNLLKSNTGRHEAYVKGYTPFAISLPILQECKVHNCILALFKVKLACCDFLLFLQKKKKGEFGISFIYNPQLF